MSYGVIPEGFAPKSRSAILLDLETALLADVPDADVSSDSVYGLLLGLFADALGSVWEQAALTYAQAYPDTATGAAFAALARLTACTQLHPTPSQVDVLLTGTPAASVPSGTVFSGGPGTPTVALTAIATIGGGGTVTARATAAVTGPEPFPAGAIDTIDTPVAGLSSVSQPADAVVVGTDLETEPDWRIRRETSLRAIGGASVDGIRARVLEVAGVTECYVFVNDTDTIDADSVPAHAFEVVARHDASATIQQAVLDAVLASKPAGIYAHGSTSGTSTDASGVARTVRYSQPTPTSIYVDVDVVTDGTETSEADLVAAVKAAIVAKESSYKIGNNVTASRLVPAVVAVGDLVYDVAITVGTSASPTGSEVVLDRHHVAAFDTSRITVTVTHASDV